MEIERQVGRNERHINEIYDNEPKLRTFDSVSENSAKITKKDDYHKSGALAVHPLRTQSASNRERPREAEGKKHQKFEYLCYGAWIHHRNISG